MQNQKYYLGLDIGTGSVGYSVTDLDYNLIKRKGKDLWGSILFDSAKTAIDRRRKRSERRTLQKQKFRIATLQSIFKEEIEKVDKDFFPRLKASSLWEDDKEASGIFSRNSLFFDGKLNDKEFFKKNPTIYHLRSNLLENPAEDIRFLYLAIHNIMKHRGNFLFESFETEGASNCLSELFKGLEEAINDNEDFSFLSINVSGEARTNLNDLEKTIAQENLSKSNINDALIEIFGKFSKNKKAMFSAMLGNKVNAKSIFSTKENDFECEESIDSFAVEEEKFQEFLIKVEEADESASKILLCLKKIYDRISLQKLLNGEKYLCVALKNKFEMHKDQLRNLKDNIIKKYYIEEYNNIFKVKDSERDNYANYIQGVLKSEEKEGSSNNKIKHEKCSQEKFYTFLRKILESKAEVKDLPEIQEILNEMDRDNYLPKLRTSANSLIPHQVNKSELETILKISATKFDFLNQKDEKGISNIQKILDTFEFKVDYFVGPLTRRDNSQNSWLVTTSEEKIMPWNYKEIVDFEACEKAFIERMTNYCSFLLDEKVLPKNSLLYSEYAFLNELNAVKINGERLNQKIKEEAISEAKRNGTLTIKKLKEIICREEGLSSNEIVVSGLLEKKFQTNLNVFKQFNSIFNGVLLDDKNDTDERKKEKGKIREKIEEIIAYIAVCSDKKRLEKKLKNEYSDILNAEQIKKIKGLELSGFGNFSKKFLDGITGLDMKTGEVATVIEFMRENSLNLQEILMAFGFTEKLEAIKSGEGKLTYEHVQELYCSPMVKRGVWQSIKLIKEVEKIMGCKPEKIFVEVTRAEIEDKNVKDSRKKKVNNLYKEMKQSFDNNIDELQKRLDNEKNLSSDKLFLYFMQEGKCMYTGEPIELSDLALYDIDHIIPQSKIKDDSLDNKVLSNKVYNEGAKRADIVKFEIQQKMKPFWKHLLDNKLISGEKFNRLTRATEYTDKELDGFVNRQMVTTNQSAKAVIDLLRKFYGTEVIFSKAKYVSEFRNAEFEGLKGRRFDNRFRDAMVKCRDLNNLHHAKDAYLNIFVGNVFDEMFTKKYYLYNKGKSSDEIKEKNINNLFARDIPNVFDSKRHLNLVIETMEKNTPFVSFVPRQVSGGFFDETIYKTNKHQKDFATLDEIKQFSSEYEAKFDGARISLKGENNLLSNTQKYGHKSSYTTSFFTLIQYQEKNKIIKKFIAIPYILVRSQNYDLRNVISIITGLTDFEILVPKVSVGSILKIGNGYFKLAGKNGESFKLHNFNQVFLPLELNRYFKKVCKIIKKIKAKAEFGDKDFEGDNIIVSINNEGKKSYLTPKENLVLFNELVNHMSKSFYKYVSISDVAHNLKKSVNKFTNLDCLSQVKVLQGIIDVLCGKSGGDLTSLNFENKEEKKKFSKASGVMAISNFNDKPFAIINSSLTGVYSNKKEWLNK